MTYNNHHPEIQLSTDYQIKQVGAFADLIKSTVETEKLLSQSFEQRTGELDREYERAVKSLDDESRLTLSDLDSGYLEKLEKARHQFETNCQEADRDRNATSDDVSRHRSEAISDLKLDHEGTVAQIEDTHDQNQKKTEEDHVKVNQRCSHLQARFQQIRASADHLLAKRGLALVAPDQAKDVSDVWSSTHLKNYDGAIKQAEVLIAVIRNRPACRFVDDGWSVLLAIFLTLVFGALLFSFVPMPLPAVLGMAAAAALVSTIAVHWCVKRFARHSAEATLPDLQTQINMAAESILAAPKAAKQETQAALRELLQRRRQNLADAQREMENRTADAEQQAVNRRTRLERLFAAKLQELEQSWNDETEKIRGGYEPRIQAKKEEFSQRRRDLDSKHQAELSALNQEHGTRWNQLSQRWQAGLASFERCLMEMSDFCSRHFPEFREVDWDNWSSAGHALRAIQTGRIQIKSNLLAKELPTNDRLGKMCPDTFEMPAALTFPENPSLVLNAHDAGREQAASIIRNVMLRLMASSPPGKVRFTIIDPVGLGQNFSAFMHLADFDEGLINNRIWTEATHIHHRLADLTEHMENVIQKYLRNEFDSIHQYNEHAGEVAEVFQVLVIANFPVNFSEESIRRLISITNSGPRCGVFTLLSRDTKLTLPRGLDPDDLYRFADVFDWTGDRFVANHEVLRPFDVSLDMSPDEPTTTKILKSIGKHAEAANRVEVPFQTVVPAVGDEWTKSAASEISVPLGRAGAVRLLSLQLGKGTSQHVLVSGKTGSGKSTLLHALITNMALHYPPEEVEFYLIDFKKGVEFKAYADYQLPHARVIAIESEREFGMSVLQRLDQELRQRGDQFRQAGVQSLKAFRESQPDTPMPRVMFIVDEFQEYFVNDDRIAHDASLLLDRLVRQGRAFGLHVILGSQTLAGAYSLARSTLGQMAVRVALQCSAADAHLILSEDNTAARLLSRPGEAIYNDANGLLEGNNPFQVVWLSDLQKSEWLERIREIADRHGIQKRAAIVFEGNAAADLAENRILQDSLDVLPSSNVIAMRAWLGSAVEIKDPTSVVFRRQHGSNLLMVGQRPELAAGILTSLVVSLTAGRGFRDDTSNTRSVRFYLFDGQRADERETAFGDRLSTHMPADLHTVAPSRTAESINEIASEMEKRTSGDGVEEPIFLVIYDLARFRALQSEDDFGFSSFGEEEKTDIGKQFASIVLDGPPVGIHVVVWSDSYNNANRWFTRQTLREFGMRVLFQTSAVDSSNLIDSAAAAHLGAHRALLYSDDSTELEKFRPYAIPTIEFLETSREKMIAASFPSNDGESGPPPSEAGSFAT